MRISEILKESTQVEYIGVDDETDYDILNSADQLVRNSGLNMLRDDNITDVAMVGDEVVGVLYSSTDGDELHWSIAVADEHRGTGIAKRLYSRIWADSETALVAELIPPYTLEQFVKSQGYKKISDHNGFRVYRKQISHQ